MNVMNGKNVPRKVNRFVKFLLKSVKNVMNVMNGKIFVKLVGNVINVILSMQHQRICQDRIGYFIKCDECHEWENPSIENQ